MKYLMTWLCAGLLALASGNALAGPADTLNDLTQQMETLEGDFSHYSGGLVKSLDERLQNGIVLQGSGDHMRAEYIFMDIVAHEEWRGKPGFQTAEYLLANSLYEDGYYRLSQKYLIDLLKTGVGSERTNGVVLLLQVAQKTGDWTEVNEALANVSDFANAPAYLYIMGRAMFLQGDYETARTCLNAVKNDDEWAVKATYLLGVLDCIDGNFDSALIRFENVSNDTHKYHGSQDVKELAILARARVYYEQTQWSKSLECYQMISEDSKYFADVLYELGWTHIRNEDYQAAQQKFELLILSYPDDRRVVESRRLLADLKRELGEFDDAMVSYQKIVDEFEPVMTEMEREADQLDYRKVEFQRSIESEQYDDVQIVPERAKGLVAVGSDVTRVQNMIGDLIESDANTSESDDIVAEINAALQSDTSVRYLPEFQKYTHEADNILINALLVGYDFTRDYDKVGSTLDSLIGSVRNLPRTSQERDVYSSILSRERDDREVRYLRARLEIDSLRHKLRILKSWMNSGRTSSLSEEEVSELTMQIHGIENRIRELKPKQERIEQNMRQVRSFLRTGSSDVETERQKVDEFRQELLRTWQNTSAKSSEYHQLIAQEKALLDRLDRFDANVEESIRVRVNDFRARLERESVLLEAEKERYVSMKSDVGMAAGEISARYWQSVFEQIRDMVLTADLGMVDIAWLKKDARSKELAQAMEDRKKEREELENDFKQFLKESGQE